MKILLGKSLSSKLICVSLLTLSVALFQGVLQSQSRNDRWGLTKEAIDQARRNTIAAGFDPAQLSKEEQALRETVSRRENDINKALGGKFKGHLREEVLNQAIKSLGLHRSASSVGLLCQQISTPVYSLALESTELHQYPWVHALIKIGSPSVREILRRMKPNSSAAIEYPERDLHLFAYVIREVDGYETGLFRLELAAKDAEGTHKLNLLNLIEIYEKKESELEILKSVSSTQ